MDFQFQLQAVFKLNSADKNYKFMVSHPASAAYLGNKAWDSKNVFNEANIVLEKLHNSKIIW